MTSRENSYEPLARHLSRQQPPRSQTRVRWAWGLVAATYVLVIGVVVFFFQTFAAKNDGAPLGDEFSVGSVAAHLLLFLSPICLALSAICAIAALVLGDTLQRLLTIVAPLVLLGMWLGAAWVMLDILGFDLLPAPS